MARRAASISRAVMRQRSVALRPYSPKATKLPRWALPAILPLNCLRNLVRFGCIMWCYLNSALRRCRGLCRLGAWDRCCRLGFGVHHLGFRLVEHFALEYPNLDADHAVRGLRLREPVINVGAEGVQRHASLAVALGARDFRSVQAARNAHLDAQRAGAHGVGHRALHGAAEHHALLELLRYAFRDQLGVELGFAYLGDVEPHVLHGHAKDLGDSGAQLLDILALLANHDSRPRRVNGDVGAPRRTLDENAADRRIGELLAQILPHQVIGVDVRGKRFGVGIPFRRPIARNAETNANRINFLTHTFFTFRALVCRRTLEPGYDYCAWRCAHRAPWRARGSA